jgi:hypothetical protein
MDPRVRDLTANLQPRSPGSPQLLQEAAIVLAFTWPDDYRAFMVEQDGGEGFVGKSYLGLSTAGGLVVLNQDSGISKFAPDLVAFGSDGAGECFAFDRRHSPAVIVMVPFVGLDQPIAQGTFFVDFLERLRDDRLFSDSSGDIHTR